MSFKVLCLSACLLLPFAASTPAGAADPIGQPAPAFALPALAGTGSVSLDKLRGQVVMINFWASWCVPCRQEFPLLDQMYKQYKGVGFTILGVNVEPDSKDAEAFLAKMPVSFPILTDKDSSASKLYHVEGMPSTALVDRHGVLRWVHRSYQAGDENEYLNQVRGLLREK